MESGYWNATNGFLSESKCISWFLLIEEDLLQKSLIFKRVVSSDIDPLLSAIRLGKKECSDALVSAMVIGISLSDDIGKNSNLTKLLLLSKGVIVREKNPFFCNKWRSIL